MPVAVPEFQLLLARLAADLGVKVERLLAQMDRLDRREALAFITDAYPHLASPYVQAAADATAVYYGEQPTTSTTEFIPDVPADLVTVEQLAASGRWALLQSKPIVALQGSAQRAVLTGSRDTMIHNAIRERAKWARHASANACSFCKLMATRGAVYTSQDSASRVVGRGVDLSEADRRAIAGGLMTRDEALYRRSLYRNERQAKAAGAKVGDTRRSVGATRGARKVGDKYHDRCHCIAVCVRPGDTYEPPPYVEQWERDYIQATREASQAGDTKGSYGAIDVKAIVRRMDVIDQERKAPAPAGPSGPIGPTNAPRTGFGDPGDDEWRRIFDHAWERHAPDAHTRGHLGSKLPAGMTREQFEATISEILARPRLTAPAGEPDEALRAQLDAGEAALVEQRERFVNLYARSGDIRYEVRLAGAHSTAHPIDGAGITRHVERDGNITEQQLPLGKRPVPGWDRPNRG